MNKKDIIQKILAGRNSTPMRAKGQAFLPSNIALCKYWGKRDDELNLPTTPSLSISLGQWGAHTQISLISTDNIDDKKSSHLVYLNGKLIEKSEPFFLRLQSFLDLFQIQSNLSNELNKKTYYKIETDMNIPMGAGLASSACGIAALVKALDHLYDWGLTETELSILGRLGSGSASRSFWHGFVEWQMGVETDGFDSFAKVLPFVWPELRIGLWIVSEKPKNVSSRAGMKQSVLTSPFYTEWPKKHAQDFAALKMAIHHQDFKTFGETAESNALAMHALMMTTSPPIVYALPETLEAMHRIWQCREAGLDVYFTQDAGPNLKLLFLEKDTEALQNIFKDMQVIAPFETFKVEEQVVLVNEQDEVMGLEEKLKAHQKGLLHRAFSVFIYRKKEEKVEILCQQRQKDKYHCGGLWTNTCCSHPRLGEDIVLAGQRRLKEEMSMQVPLTHIGSFIYKARFDNGLIEHELDHVLIGEYKAYDTKTENPIQFDPEEVQDYRWISIEQLQVDLTKHAKHYTPWFKTALNLVLEELCLSFL